MMVIILSLWKLLFWDCINPQRSNKVSFFAKTSFTKNENVSLKYTGRKMWSNIPENLKSLSPYYLENNIKTSCAPAILSKFCWFSFICLSLLCNIVFMPLFSLVSSTCTTSHPTPLYRYAFLPLFIVVFFTYFIWRWFDAVCYFSLTTCEASSIKN